MSIFRIVSSVSIVLGLSACGGSVSESGLFSSSEPAFTFDSVSSPTGTLTFDQFSGFSGLAVMDYDRFEDFRAAALSAGTTLTYQGTVIFEDDFFAQDVSSADATYFPANNVLSVNIDANSLVPAISASGQVLDYGDTIPSMIDDTVVSSDANRSYGGLILAEFHGENAGGIAVYSYGIVAENTGGSYELYGAGALNR